MRRHEQQTRTIEARVCVEVRCDLCGRVIDIHAEALVPGAIQHEVTVEHRSIVRLPSGAVLRRCELDICGVCFEDRLVPWVAGHGHRQQVAYEEEPA